MLIHINKSKLFTVDPAIRFGKEFNVNHDVWKELWRRYKLLSYTVPELVEYLQIKTGRQTNNKTIKRWIVRTEIYGATKTARDKGATTVVSSYFNELEQEVLKELTKGMRFSGTKKPNNIV